MTDLELADWLENWEGSFKCEIPCGSPEAPTCMCGKRIDQIIAALRRGPERPPSGERVMVSRFALDSAADALERNDKFAGGVAEDIRRWLSAAEAEGRKG